MSELEKFAISWVVAIVAIAAHLALSWVTYRATEKYNCSIGYMVAVILTLFLEIMLFMVVCAVRAILFH